jgi:hypothetical protein
MRESPYNGLNFRKRMVAETLRDPHNKIDDVIR